MNGYVRLNRDILNDPIINGDADSMAIWTYILLNASAKQGNFNVDGLRINLEKGEFLVTTRLISMHLNIAENKVNEILKKFEKNRKIEQVFYYRCRLIKITDKSFLDK